MPDTTTTTAPRALAERRCWRCLHMFPGDASRGALAREEFWLCHPCETTLLPSKQRAT
jgi:hypothetical protein